MEQDWVCCWWCHRNVAGNLWATCPLVPMCTVTHTERLATINWHADQEKSYLRLLVPQAICCISLLLQTWMPSDISRLLYESSSNTALLHSLRM